MSIRADFPILARQHEGRSLVYLDSGATTQKPNAVINAVRDYYSMHNANVHRAAHILADEATRMLEGSRQALQQFINAAHHQEIIFTRGTTEAVNLVANSLQGLCDFKSGDEILITLLEHHSNIVPWQLLAQRTGATLRAVDITEQGDLDLDDFHAKLSEKTKLFTCNHVSNALGTVNPIADLISAAKAAGALTLIDGAQAPLHQSIDVQSLDCDFYAFSGHKMFGPTGVGVLYGKLALLEAMPPWQGGGEMIEHVSLQVSTYQAPPYRFEAGTPNIAGIVGLGAAVEYIQSLPLADLIAAEAQLVSTAASQLKQIPGLSIVAEPKEHASVLSFTFADGHPHDIGTLMDQQGVAVRTGHHCTMPLMDRLGINGTVRASFSLYNDASDVERLVQAVDKASSFL